MARQLYKLLIAVTSSENLADLKQHVAMALSGSFGLEDVVMIEEVIDPPEAPKEDTVDGPEGSN